MLWCKNRGNSTKKGGKESYGVKIWEIAPKKRGKLWGNNRGNGTNKGENYGVKIWEIAPKKGGKAMG